MASTALDETVVAQTKAQEFRRGWPILLASMFGAGVGVSCLLNYTSGLFVKDLEAAIGLTRTEFGLAFLLATVGVGIALPAVGAVVDRYGVRWPTVFGATGLAITFLGFGTFVTSVTSYTLFMILMGLLGTGASTLTFTRAINSWFDRGRGLALGLTQAGVGIAGTIIPPLVAFVIQNHGWRAGYFMLAGIASLGVISAFLLLRTREEHARQAPLQAPPEEISAAFRSRVFWLQLAAFVGMTLAFAGIMIHFVPIVREMGLSAMQAAGFAALIGGSVLASRLLVGWLADMVHAPWLAVAACGFGMVACVALASNSVALIPLAAVCVGCAMGAELDLLSYITARYFPLRIYGRVYAWQYGGVTMAGGASPLWIGWTADQTGDYRLALIGCGALAVVVICLFLILPRYSIEHPSAESAAA
ncbi:MAG TPA: MFS transporter [Sphingobium sp.]|nr:MFS transporter [Sphingobium sp.]